MENKKIEYTIHNTNCKVILEVCNLFEQEGLKVVHFYHTFDTDDQVMLGKSVMGQFIQLCKDKEVGLDEQIEKWIKNMNVNLLSMRRCHAGKTSSI